MKLKEIVTEGQFDEIEPPTDQSNHQKLIQLRHRLEIANFNYLRYRALCTSTDFKIKKDVTVKGFPKPPIDTPENQKLVDRFNRYSGWSVDAFEQKQKLEIQVQRLEQIIRKEIFASTTPNLDIDYSNKPPTNFPFLTTSDYDQKNPYFYNSAKFNRYVGSLWSNPHLSEPNKRVFKHIENQLQQIGISKIDFMYSADDDGYKGRYFVLGAANNRIWVVGSIKPKGVTPTGFVYFVDKDGIATRMPISTFITLSLSSLQAANKRWKKSLT